jgi:hypothetical protein
MKSRFGLCCLVAEHRWDPRIRVETAVGRHKAIIGPKLRARILPAQQGEAAMATEVLNRMIRVAKPISMRIA